MDDTDNRERTPHQNRVDPVGNIISTKARGAWLGNRGNIHNEAQQIVRPFKLNAWLICLLHFKNRHRQIMMPGLWTELFFLDEATAFAAGHRPCFECRREDAMRFKTYWLQGNPEYRFTLRTSIQEIDTVLQRERIKKDSSKVLYEAQIDKLPDGSFILWDDQPYLICKWQMHLWTPFGYGAAQPLPSIDMISVLTPQSIVNAFQAGYSPQIDASHSHLPTAGR